eukprot:s18_g47.t1
MTFMSQRSLRSSALAMTSMLCRTLARVAQSRFLFHCIPGKVMDSSLTFTAVADCNEKDFWATGLDGAVHVLEIPPGLEDVDGSTLAVALVVLRRHSGFLLALPLCVFSAEVLAQGLVAGEEEQIGQSLQTLVTAGALSDFQEDTQPQPEEEAFVEVLLVDVSAELGNSLRRFDAVAHPLDILHAFHPDNPFLMPLPGDLVQQTWQWVRGPGAGNLLTFYSAEEGDSVPEIPSPPVVRRSAKAKAGVPNGGGPAEGRGGVPEQNRRAPRVTVASLATSLEQVNNSLPAIVQQLEMLSKRTEAMEVQLQADRSRPSALQQPLGSSTMSGSGHGLPPPVDLLKQMPPPKSTMPHGVSKVCTGALRFSSGGPGAEPGHGCAGVGSRRDRPSSVLQSCDQRGGTDAVCGEVRRLWSDPRPWSMLLDHLQNDNYLAAKDSAALLAVCLEQASLDSGKLDVALLLSLSGDPPAGVFQNRAITNYAKGRAFVPLAEQRWVTIALAYIKEMVIAPKRLDATNTKADKDPSAQTPGPKKAPKKQAKGGGKKNQQQNQDEEE